MFNWILNLVSGDYNQNQINKFAFILKEITHHYEAMESLSDDQIKAKTIEFKERLSKGETLDSILPEAFATVKQACKRMVGSEVEVKGEKLTWNMVPYDVQLIGGMVLHKGKIAEMKTGEGKTLVAVMPVYLNALEGKGVHVVTVNDYLASRDAQWMGHVYTWLGLTVGCVTKGSRLDTRRDEYSKDITYVENSELGFDYLRDNLVKSMSQRSLVRRPLNYAIVDEIDSILIDEARTPLIISEARQEPTEKYQYYAKIVRSLSPCANKKKVSKGLLQELMQGKEGLSNEEDGDYYIDEKTKTASLSGKGIAKLESMLGVQNLYKDIGYEEIHHIENALRAQAVYEKDKEYIVKDGEVLIVDEHTGRTMPGRRFSEGLHQAIEAKEGVEIQRESQTMATITYQNFFRQYKKLGGMTGTAATEGEEFMKIYDLEVLVIPTNKPTIRIDRTDKVYFNQHAKRKFVKEYIKFYHDVGQPILIGTANIATSEYVSSILEKENIIHYVLNAKFHEQEAHIVAQAGKYKSVVVATNMAGRGTDIKLEKGLNEKIADNYMRRIETAVKSNNLVMNIFSTDEYELTMDACKRVYGISDEQIRTAEKDEILIGDVSVRIQFLKRKDGETKPFAQIICKKKNREKAVATIEKDMHYGLFILGTEKHESRRIDNQLRGRAGRQGDPGISVFFVALDDLIMRKMGGERIQAMASMLMKKEDLENLELTQKQFTSSIVRAQKQMEGRHFGIRKQLFDYDSVINEQRKRVYKKRDEIILSETDETLMKTYVSSFTEEMKDSIAYVVSLEIGRAKTFTAGEDLIAHIQKQFSLGGRISFSSLPEHEEELIAYITTQVTNFFVDSIKDIPLTTQYMIYRDVSLHYLDKLWVAHLDDMQYLRDKVGLMGYAQMDPLIVYKKEAFDKFQTLISNYKGDVTNHILSLDFSAIATQQQSPQVKIKQENIDPEYVKMLQDISKSMNDALPPAAKKAPKTAKAVFQDEDGFEVFEVNDEQVPVSEPVDLDMSGKKKIRPNDKVSVKYTDGTIKTDLKYKKVEDDVEQGKCVIL